MHTVATTIFITVLLFAAASGQFVNDWDRPFTFQCRRGYVLKSVYSVHSNHKEDRRWAFRCSRAPNRAFPTRCYWTGYVNYWDAVMNFVCNRDFVIAGVHSVHDNRREDRRFRFKCCSHPGLQRSGRSGQYIMVTWRFVQFVEDTVVKRDGWKLSYRSHCSVHFKELSRALHRCDLI
ncbi:hemagglutinin/amebocyte aggregation factor [Plakobranchus ocellatus]|uniref:Hemagglutinin/amebocyte aggregation factor n=1 Tax=Plakobranchus ocellatus TaxID=259542 RepID=A0AAV4C154_9GAST|nr:hemagglutinin/amebocyte aggregation factor [Plakobranchus ocellatus]